MLLKYLPRARQGFPLEIIFMSLRDSVNIASSTSTYMADVDEDVIRPLQAGVDNHDGDEDGEDDTCDFRFLSSLNLTTAATGALPKRGIKDFEPHPTSLQVNTLAASRQAMREALSHTRMHLPKNHVLGVYNAKTGLTRVKQVKGQMFRNIGKDVSGGGVDLLPEEALWALERGSLDIRWDSGDEHGEEEGLPMSLQGAYAAFIGEEEEGRGHITIEKYQVYAGLKRVGYTVLRSEEWDGEAENTQDLPRTHESSKTSALFSWLQSLFVGGKPSTRASLQRAGPLVRPGLFRSYGMYISLIRCLILMDRRRNLSDVEYNFLTERCAPNGRTCAVRLACERTLRSIFAKSFPHYMEYL